MRNKCDNLIAAKKDGKYGIINNVGDVVMPFIYIDANICGSDVISVPQNGKWGYIDVKGNNITPFQFDSTGGFYDGLAVVSMNGKYGYVNRQGELVIPCVYDSASAFYQGLANVYEIVGDVRHAFAIDKVGKKTAGDKDYIVSSKGDALIGKYITDEELYGKLWTAPFFKEALLDNEGNRLTEFSYAGISEFKDGIAISGKYYTPGYGMINRYGEEVVPFIFDSIEMIDEDTYMVKVYDKDRSNCRSGIMTLPADAAERKPSFVRPITVYLDGLDLYFDTEPAIADGRTMVPMRKIFETLGSEVSWNEQARKVTAIKDGISVELKIGNNTAIINGETVTLDVPAVIENNRTLVPLRFVAESLDCDVNWDADTRRVEITTSKGN